MIIIKMLAKSQVQLLEVAAISQWVRFLPVAISQQLLAIGPQPLDARVKTFRHRPLKSLRLAGALWLPRTVQCHYYALGNELQKCTIIALVYYLLAQLRIISFSVTMFLC